MARFEVGKLYYAESPIAGTIRVVSRSSKMITVEKTITSFRWKMVIRKDDSGDEYAVDCSSGKKWRDAFTYRARYKVDE